MNKEEFNKLGLGNYKPLGEIVFEYLRNLILEGELKPGERLMEINLAEQLGVSRTPVREAIRKLEKEKFVEMIPRKGAYVAELTTKDAIDVLEIRKLLEGHAAYLASQNMTSEEIEILKEILDNFDGALNKMDRQGMIDFDNSFHDEIFKSTNNEKLIEIVQSLHDQFQRFRLNYFNEHDDYYELQRNHKLIYESIKNREPEDARFHSEAHIEQLIRTVMKWQERENSK
ncbi:MAG: GntR family transcriptional regulator [Firmicutes bacterium]|jgi:DNA-binding GntR family transcriptional regulator|nr:GntR family transcriptional regulator [Bacillota bacterium]